MIGLPFFKSRGNMIFISEEPMMYVIFFADTLIDLAASFQQNPVGSLVVVLLFAVVRSRPGKD